MKHFQKRYKALALTLALVLCLGLLTACGGEGGDEAAASTQSGTHAAQNGANPQPNAPSEGDSAQTDAQQGETKPAETQPAETQPAPAQADSKEDLEPYPNSDTMEDLPYSYANDSMEDLPTP